MLLIQRHRLLDLPALPHAPAGVVRRAEDGHVDVSLGEAVLHVLEVHAPGAGLVAHERRVDDLEAVVLERAREAHVGGAVHEHRVAGRRKGRERGDHAAEHAVLVADVTWLEVAHALAVAMPVDDGLVVGIARAEVTEGGVCEALLDGARDGGRHGEVHVRDPHGDGVEALVRRGIPRARRANGVERERVMPGTVEDGREVVGHGSPFAAVFLC